MNVKETSSTVTKKTFKKAILRKVNNTHFEFLSIHNSESEKILLSFSVVSTSCTEQKNKKKNTIFTSPVKVTIVDSPQEVKFEVPFFAGLIS